MSTAAAVADAAPPAKAGKKKLIIMIVAALVLVLGGGGAAFVLLKKPAETTEDEAQDGHAKAKSKPKAEAHAAPQPVGYDPKHPPVFVPLDPFTVNLADKDSERYAQVGLTLEIDSAATGEQLKLLMPAIRNNILMVLSHKTSAQLLTVEGKEKLARSILYASVRPLGYQAYDDEEEDEAESATRKRKKRRAANAVYPVRAVHFSNFIVQ